MAGNKANLTKMWKTLKEDCKLDLEPSTPLVDNVYLGMGQTEFTPDPKDVAEKTEVYNKYFAPFSLSAKDTGGAQAQSVCTERGAEGKKVQKQI